jgi:hypothetical protein
MCILETLSDLRRSGIDSFIVDITNRQLFHTILKKRNRRGFSNTFTGLSEI